MPLVSSNPPAEPPTSQVSPDSPSGDASAVSISAPDAAPVASTSARQPFRDSRLRPVLSCAGALGVGLALAPLFLRPGNAPAATSGGPLPEVAMAQEETLIVTPTLPPGVLLRGRLRLVAGATDAVGRAPVGGQVARQLVENGARVQRGDAIVEISSGVSQRTAPVAESRQDRAEQSQIAASDAQTALAQKISTAQTRLNAAQERVERAQAQTTVARDVVRRLQNGQNVSPDEIPAPFAAAQPKTQSRTSRSKRGRNRERSARGQTPRLSREAQIASRQAEAAREAATESSQTLQTARDMLLNAQNVARQADEKAQSSAQAVVDVESRFDAKKASGADVEAARAAQKEAQNAVSDADKALIFAKTELGKREKNAATAQSYAQTSAAQAAKTLANARLDAPESSANASIASDDAPEAAADTNAGNNPAASGSKPPARVTLDNAIRFASEALDESRRASRDAERIHNEIETYQTQVTRSSSRVEAATQNLANAQQGVMNSVPRVRFTSTYAPSSGIVTWISRLAREVGAGEAVFGIARTQRVAAHFEDKSGLWRAIKPGSVLTAFVVDAPALPNSTASTSPVAIPEAPSAVLEASPKSAPEKAALPLPALTTALTEVTQLGAGHAVELKMTEVQAPQTPGETASLTGALLPGAANEKSANAVTSSDASSPAGAQILVSVPRPHQKAALNVPASALVQRGALTYVAVLAPLSAAENQAQNREKNAAVSNNSPISSDSATNPVGANAVSAEAAKRRKSAARQIGAGEAFHLRWVRVETGRSDGMRLEIVAGLHAGERVVNAPDDLEAMGFSPTPDTQSTVFDTNHATPTANQASQAPTNAEVLVRLSPSLA